MVIRLDIKPLSINEAWKGRRYKTDKYTAFEKESILKMPYSKNAFKAPLRVDICFGFSNTLSDIDNPLKPILDCLQKKYGFNDRDVYELNVKKEIVDIGKEFINIEILTLKTKL